MRGRRIFFISGAVMLILAGGVASAGADAGSLVWSYVNSGIREADMRMVTTDPRSPDTVYSGSLSAVYRSDDGGGNWSEVLSFRGTGIVAEALYVSPDGSAVLAGTSGGLYISDDRGVRWAKIFSGVSEDKSSVHSIAAHRLRQGRIIIGTSAGLYRTADNVRDWHRDSGLPAGSPVTFVMADQYNADILYAVSGNSLYRSLNSGTDWQDILASPPESREDIVTDEEPVTEDGGPVYENVIRAVANAPGNNSRLYAATVSGLLISEDRGSSWERAGSSGLISGKIQDISICPEDTDGLYAATDNGVFRYSVASDSWMELYHGLPASDIRALRCAADPKTGSAVLWAATNRGMFRAGVSPQASFDSEATGADQVLAKFDLEPSIDDVRNAAIEYAEVQPEKIERWRKAASKRALLPDLTFSFNRNKAWQRSTYFYSTKEEKYKDNDITNDRDRDWSVSLRWDLGELIWNDDQTSIDSRSKLMTELRNDVLNEVTRLYFERRRLQVEMLMSPAGDIRARLEKEIRLQELTADIDAVTGSYLSKRLGQLRGAGL